MRREEWRINSGRFLEDRENLKTKPGRRFSQPPVVDSTSHVRMQISCSWSVREKLITA
jgi:hypothetical protein